MKDDIGYDNVVDQLGYALREYCRLQAAITLFNKREYLDYTERDTVTRVLLKIAEGK